MLLRRASVSWMSPPLRPSSHPMPDRGRSLAVNGRSQEACEVRPRLRDGRSRRPRPGSDGPAAASLPPRVPARERGRADVTRASQKVRARSRAGSRGRNGRCAGSPAIAPETIPSRGSVASTLWSLGHGGRGRSCPRFSAGRGVESLHTTMGRRGGLPPLRPVRVSEPRSSGSCGFVGTVRRLCRAERTPHATSGAYIRNWMPARRGNAHQVLSIWSDSSSPASPSTGSKSSEFRKIARVSAPRKSPTFSEAW